MPPAVLACSGAVSDSSSRFKDCTECDVGAHSHVPQSPSWIHPPFPEKLVFFGEVALGAHEPRRGQRRTV
eukprot:5915567-Pyramimonas_sp.AAC.1